MTETEWLTSVDPLSMFRALSEGALVAGGRHAGRAPHGPWWERKLRLFTEACKALGYCGARPDVDVDADHMTRCVMDVPNCRHVGTVANFLRCLFNPFRPVVMPKSMAGLSILGWPMDDTVRQLALAAEGERQGRACGRCGGSGRKLEREPWMLAGEGWSTACPDCGGSGQVGVGLLDPDALAVLADAVEEAGCTDADLLGHLRGKQRCPSCRGDGWLDGDPPGPKRITCRACNPWGSGWVDLPGPHVLGCWAIDLILNKE